MKHRNKPVEGAESSLRVELLQHAESSQHAESPQHTETSPHAEQPVRAGISDGFPIFIGYIPVAVAFGLLAKTVGLTLVPTGLMSLLVFAGASQFMALNMIRSGAGVGEIVTATFLLNFRHLIMSAAVTARLRETVKRRRLARAVAAFGVTDETFAVSMTKRQTVELPYLIALNAMAWSGWFIGTIAGFTAGTLMPPKLQMCLGILLYVMFVAILVPAVKKERKALLVAGLAGGINLLLGWAGWLGSGWNMVLAILSASALYTGMEEWRLRRHLSVDSNAPNEELGIIDMHVPQGTEEEEHNP